MNRQLVAWLCRALCLAGAGCSAPQPAEHTYSVRVSATADDGTPLEAVQVKLQGQRGASDTKGRWTARVAGREGQVIPVGFACPTGYEASSKTPILRLTNSRALGASVRTQELPIDVSCTRNMRDVVIVVDAQGGDGLPVLVDGQERAMTDANGNAHALLALAKSTARVHVSLDTSRRPELRPQTPSRSFELTGVDAILLFEQQLSPPAASKKRRPPKKAPRHIPYPLR